MIYYVNTFHSQKHWSSHNQWFTVWVFLAYFRGIEFILFGLVCLLPALAFYRTKPKKLHTSFSWKPLGNDGLCADVCRLAFFLSAK